MKSIALAEYTADPASRYTAAILDCLLVVALTGTLGSFLGREVFACLPLVDFLYHGLFESGLFAGQTLGKFLMKIRVLDREGYCLTLPRSFARAFCRSLTMSGRFLALFAPALAGAYLWFLLYDGLSFFIFIFDASGRRSLHDRYLGTWVIRGHSTTVSRPWLVSALALALLAITYGGTRYVRQALPHRQTASYYPLVEPYQPPAGLTAEAAAQIKARALNGDALAEYELGILYRNGLGMPRDPEEGRRWIRQAATQGDPAAQFHIAATFYADRNDPEKAEQYMKWLQQSAQGGFAEAQLMLATHYEKGQGVPRDPEKALKWGQLAAENGNRMAQYWLGIAYHTGAFGPKDHDLAWKWLMKAAEQGYAPAMDILRRAVQIREAQVRQGSMP